MSFLLLLAGIFKLPIFGGEGDPPMAAVLGLASAAMAWLPISYSIRYRGTVLILDTKGIWLERKGIREGRPWESVCGYEKKPGELSILTHEGEAFKLPVRRNEGYPKFLYRVLDRRIGPDGHRMAPPRPTDPVLAKIEDYYGNVPPVEMEPDVIYRQGNRDIIRRNRRSDWPQAGIVTFGGLFCLMLPLGLLGRNEALSRALSICLAVGFIVFTAGLVMCGLSIYAIRRSEDRLVMRDGTYFRIRKGRELRLPPPHLDLAKTFSNQPITRFGKGPFAFEASMQFLEPDV